MRRCCRTRTVKRQASIFVIVFRFQIPCPIVNGLVRQAKTLADLVPLQLAAPMQYEPGEKWKHTQSGINAAAHIVEVASGVTFDAFLQKRLFDPLGITNPTFYPTAEHRTRLATAYAKNKDTGALESVPPRADFGSHDQPPQGNDGLCSTALD